MRKLLEKVSTVHPVEMSPPAGGVFVTSLRHYQKQSLAVMVDTEKTSNCGGWLCDEVGMGKSAVVLALVATNPASPKTVAAKQQIEETLNAKDMYDQERKAIELAHGAEMQREQDALPNDINELELDQQDMLWDQFEMNQGLISDKTRRRIAELRPAKKLKLKATVILTSVSLIGQWYVMVPSHVILDMLKVLTPYYSIIGRMRLGNTLLFLS